MLTPEEEYMIRVNTLKYADELLAMVESLSSELNFVIESHNKRVGDPADFFDAESVHNAQMLLKDIKGENKVQGTTSESKEIHYCNHGECGFCYYTGKGANDQNGQCHKPQECDINIKGK